MTVSANWSLDDEPAYFMAVGRDMAERKPAEPLFQASWNARNEMNDANKALPKLVHSIREDLRPGGSLGAAITPPENAIVDKHGLQDAADHGITATYEDA